jgi:hypothetical protein
VSAPRRSARIARSGLAARLLTGALLGLGAALMAGQVPATADGPGDFPIAVQVTGTTASPVPGTGTRPARGGSGAAASATPAPTEVTGGNGSDGKGELPATGSDKDSVDGALAVGGLRTSYRPEANPFAGTLHVEVSVQNLSDEAIEPSVAFSLTTWTGMHLSAAPTRPLGRIAPGELRTAEADLTGVGQWAVVDAHMVLTPPEMIGGVEVDPVHRDQWIVATPWLVLAVVGLGVLGVVAWRMSGRVPVPAVAVGAPA